MGAIHEAVAGADCRGSQKDAMTLDDVREVGDGEKGVLVEDVAVKEPLEEVPRHWVRRWSRSSLFLGGLGRRRAGERHGCEARVRGSLSSRDGREEGVTGIQAASADCFI